MTEELWRWALTIALGLVAAFFWRSQDAIDKRQAKAEEDNAKRAEGQAKELAEVREQMSTMRERMAREYHSKQDLRELLSEVVVPINRAIEGLQADVKRILEKGWPGVGGKTG